MALEGDFAEAEAPGPQPRSPEGQAAAVPIPLFEGEDAEMEPPVSTEADGSGTIHAQRVEASLRAA